MEKEQRRLIKHFSIRLLKWYEKNKRDLPWRNTSNPYSIWLSEIIMQQTRVAQGLVYYSRFLATYPNIFSFAAAPEDEIMKLWQGLGYYSRARNMMKTAKIIAHTYKGVFPSSYKELIKLNGIGSYTAAAIASIAFNEPVPVVDGNVLRVISRFYGIKDPIDKQFVRKLIREKLQILIDIHNPGEFNQAVMELGAICCTPKKPHCSSCPLAFNCYALKHSVQHELPVKVPKSKPRDRFFHYLVLDVSSRFIIHKRSAKDIWKSLYDFPLIETDSLLDHSSLLGMEEVKQIIGKGKVEILDISGPIKHQLSHQTIYASFYRLKLQGYISSDESFLSILHEELGEYAFPRLIERYLEDKKLL